jgi:tripartite-type tricarboxylate transporter receptor subunit TctC
MSRTLALAAAFCFSAHSCALAQDYPARPIRVIAVSSAGGTSDIFMRALGDMLQKRLGQPLVIENRPGGAFNVGTRACAEAAPNGYTICILPGEPLVFNQFLFKTMNFDPAGLVPISQLFLIDQVLVVSESLKVKSLAELAALSKAKPGTLNYSTGSVPLGVLLERMKSDLGIDMVRVPFRGGGEAVSALLSGTTPVGFYGISNVRSLLEAGTVIGLMVDGDKRSPLFPDIPALPEAYGKTFDARSYFGLLAPGGTPKAITVKLQAAIAVIMAEPDFQRRNLIERGLATVASTPDEFAAFISRDRVLAGQIVKEAGLEPQ